MTVLNERGKDSEEHWMTKMLQHWLSIPSVSRNVRNHKLVTLTPEDFKNLGASTLPKGRAAHIIRRILFHEPTLTLIAEAFASRQEECSLAQAKKQLRSLRTEVKTYAHAAQSGLVLPGEAGLPPLPKQRA